MTQVVSKDGTVQKWVADRKSWKQNKSSTAEVQERLANVDDPARWLGFFGVAVQRQPTAVALALADEAYINDFPEEKKNKTTGQKDLVPGGLCQDCSPDDFDQEQLQMGIEVEMEHTSDRAIAQEIAMDHLTEDAHYYSKLKKVEGKDMSWLANDRGGALVPPPAFRKTRKPTLKVNKGFIQENPLL